MQREKIYVSLLEGDTDIKRLHEKYEQRGGYCVSHRRDRYKFFVILMQLTKEKHIDRFLSLLGALSLNSCIHIVKATSIEIKIFIPSSHNRFGNLYSKFTINKIRLN